MECRLRRIIRIGVRYQITMTSVTFKPLRYLQLVWFLGFVRDFITRVCIVFVIFYFVHRQFNWLTDTELPSNAQYLLLLLLCYYVQENKRRPGNLEHDLNWPSRWFSCLSVLSTLATFDQRGLIILTFSQCLYLTDKARLKMKQAVYLRSF